MTEWQPIETAPKDGTMIDLWIVSTSGAAKPQRTPNAWWEWGRWNYGNKGGFNWELANRWIKITHWMPLPEPPK